VKQAGKRRKKVYEHGYHSELDEPWVIEKTPEEEEEVELEEDEEASVSDEESSEEKSEQDGEHEKHE